MDYEKKYNEALERAKDFKNGIAHYALNPGESIVNWIFPELRKEEKPLTSFQQCLNCILRGVYYAEVPDEKVNEFILNVIRTRTDELIKLAKKQEEQKHPDGCFTCDEYKKGYEAGRSNGFTAGYNKAMKEVEQKEQKPWKVGANAYFTPEQKPVEGDNETEIQKAFREGKSAGRKEVFNHPEEYGLQKPAEWSDTNELVFKDICKHLKEEGYNGWVVLLNALRNGEFQPKPAWSKEDEKIIDTIVSVLSQYMDYKAVSDTGSGSGSAFATPRYSKEIDWLNSLRPSWKPSKEQMNALLNAKEYLLEGDQFDSAKSIAKLYEQLKKL